MVKEHMKVVTPRIRLLIGVCLCSVLLVGAGFLAYALPVQGRWIVPDTADTAVSMQRSSLQHDDSFPRSNPTVTAIPARARVPILMYHYVSELPANADRYRIDLTVTPDNFEAQLDYLDRAGYHPITLTDLYLHLTEGYPLPKKPVVLTFDDGYRDAYEVVFPRLLERGFTATFFVLATPAHFEWPQYLTWAQMKEMADAGMDIQAHGRDHVDLRGRPYDFLVYQILGAREAIEYHTGQPVRFFCYPSGQYDNNIIDVVRAAGYWGAVTTRWGVMHSLDRIFEMPRIRVRGTDTLAEFAAHLVE